MEDPDLTQPVRTRWTDKRELIGKLLDAFENLIVSRVNWENTVSWSAKKRYKGEIEDCRMEIILLLEKLR